MYIIINKHSEESRRKIYMPKFSQKQNSQCFKTSISNSTKESPSYGAFPLLDRGSALSQTQE
ncbi:hypothetical protein Scep_003787 [Stephania cephalantha]|uniref:Uncharacterized protein n=1 Tax=Stephania cephalantha TaxID=152367 RepID=A0AAP0KR64_9MAGN